MTTTRRFLLAILTTVVALVVGFSVVPAASAVTATESFSGTVSLGSAGHPATSGEISINYVTPASGAVETVGAHVSADGSFAIAGLKPGQYSFRVHDESGVYEDGFPLASMNGAMSAIRPAPPAWITLAAGQSLSFGELVMTPRSVASPHITGVKPTATHAGGSAPVIAGPPPSNAPDAGRTTSPMVSPSSFTGHVTTINGTPLAGITMTAFEFDANSGSFVTTFTTTTDAQGAYSFSSLPVDIYGIQAHDPGHNYATMNYSNESQYYQPDYIDYLGGTMSFLDFYMPAAAHIQGTVTGPSSADFTGNHVKAEVEVLDYSSGGPVWFKTGDVWPVAANGTFDVGDLSPDDYRLLFTDNADPLYPAVSTQTVTLSEGQTVSRSVSLSKTINGGLRSLAPSRLLDTRSGIGAPVGAVAPNGVVAVQVTGQGGVPTDVPVSAVVLNVTVAGSSGAGFVTAYADGTTRPTASNLNFVPGQIVPNLVVVPVGADGEVDLFNGSFGATQLIADVAGYYVSGAPAPGGFGSLAPSRLLDTRSGVGAPVGAVAANSALAVQVTGLGGVPSDGSVSAVVLNVTVAGASATGFVTAYADGASRPTASNLNFVPGQVVPNLVVVPVGANGKVALYNGSFGSTQLVADVAGYYVGGSATGAGPFGSVPPSRLLDTRSGVGAPVGAVAPNGVVSVQVTGRGGVPSSGVSAVVLNVTVAEPTATGFITAYAHESDRPTASNLNFVPGQVVPNLVVVPVDADGYVDLYNGSAGSTQLIADVAGWFAAG